MLKDNTFSPEAYTDIGLCSVRGPLASVFQRAGHSMNETLWLLMAADMSGGDWGGWSAHKLRVKHHRTGTKTIWLHGAEGKAQKSTVRCQILN